MSLLKAEIKANAILFASEWRKEMQSVDVFLAASSAVFGKSYERMTTFQAWRQHLEALITPPSLAFFLEAQNDLLTSHVFACLGSWRSSLKALRGAIDNVLFCLYYKDHPIELQLWADGNHKPTFSELFTYCEAHPVRLTKSDLDTLPNLRKEYGTLSRAVHASSITFRMTKNIKETLLWSADNAELGKWEKRERVVIQDLNLLLLSHFRSTLQGSAASGLRDVLGLSVDKSMLSKISAEYGVVLH